MTLSYQSLTLREARRLQSNIIKWILMHSKTKVSVVIHLYDFYILYRVSVQCTVYSVQCTVCSVQYAVYTEHYTVHCTLVHCTLHTARCTLHTIHCILHTVHCTLNTEHCTLYTCLENRKHLAAFRGEIV